jgi:hypothetical protein
LLLLARVVGAETVLFVAVDYGEVVVAAVVDWGI